LNAPEIRASVAVGDRAKLLGTGNRFGKKRSPADKFCAEIREGKRAWSERCLARQGA
jgi:hypothetical protein